jgi:CxxC motif-containing protein (DUF1111 family)
MPRVTSVSKWILGFVSSALLVLAVMAFFGLHPARVQAFPAVGAPLPGLSSSETNLYNRGIFPFDLNWKVRFGLGPVFTNTGCRGCHFTPVGGGSSTIENTLFGTLNPDGSFNPLTNEGGPLLQAKSVAPFVPSGACVLAGEVVPGDASIISNRHVPALFGSGLIDAIPDTTIQGNVSFEVSDPNDQRLGIHGVANMTTDYNGILRPGRFGFKAQRPTLLQFVADAFQHDVGITNPLNPVEDLPQGNPIPPNCLPEAEHSGKQLVNDPQGTSTVLILQLLEFMAPLSPAPPTSTTQAGEAVFNSIGCANCHMPSLQTGSNVTVPLTLTSSGTVASSETSAALSNQTANLYSDLLLHDMGPGLADEVVQGQASGSQWRTIPLWGLSQRTVYLHDGRTSSLNTAILDHGGEAGAVVQNYQALSPTDQSNLLAFLGSL